MKKFRTYYKGTMYYSHSDGYPGYLELYDGEWEILIMYDGGDHGERIGVDEKDVEQWSGKNDKNGVELYEGEIVRVKSLLNSDLNQNGVIEWESDHKCRFYINCGVWVPDIGDATLVLESIGNVHENRSLLDADARGEKP